MLQEADWEARYQSGDMPWEKGSGSPGLEDFLQTHPKLPRGRVLIPGCGTGHDARAWARHGFAVTGLDLAPSAIRLAIEKTRVAGFPPSPVVGFRQADFLREPPDEPYDWIFEHTLYCAIHPAERDLYGAAVRRWLRPGGHFLAVHYLIDDIDGPPFGCTESELMGRFAGRFELLERWVPRSYPNRTGLELMLWWRHRPG